MNINKTLATLPWLESLAHVVRDAHDLNSRLPLLMPRQCCLYYCCCFWLLFYNLILPLRVTSARKGCKFSTKSRATNNGSQEVRAIPFGCCLSGLTVSPPLTLTPDPRLFQCRNASIRSQLPRRFRIISFRILSFRVSFLETKHEATDMPLRFAGSNALRMSAKT